LAKKLKAFDKAASEDPLNAWCMAEARKSLEHFVKAEKDFNRRLVELKQTISLAANISDVIDAEIHLGYAYYIAGRLEDALTQYEQVINRYPGRKEAYPLAMERLVFLVSSVRGEEAAVLKLKEIASSHPGTKAAAWAVCQLGQLYRRTGSPEDAIATSTEAAMLYPESSAAPRALETVCRAYADRGVLDQAISVAERIRREYPRSLSASRAMDEVYREYRAKKNLAEVEREAREVLSQASSPEQRAEACISLYRVAEAYRRAGLTADAERAFSAAEEGFPAAGQSPVLLIQRGYELMEFRMLRQAQGCFGQALAKDPGNVQAYFGMVEASARLERPREALELLRPQDLTAGELLRAAEIFGLAGAPQEGLEMLKSVPDEALAADAALAERHREAKRYLLEVALRAAQAEHRRLAELARVMAGRAAAADDPKEKEAFAARSLGYQEKADRAEACLSDLESQLADLQERCAY